MKSLILIMGLIISVPLLTSCSKNTDQVIEDKPTDIQMEVKSGQIVTADNQFGLEIFQTLNAELEQGKNLMISPLSISLALAMVYNGAEADTKTQMEAMLHKNGLDPGQINQVYKDLVEALASHDPKVTLSIADAIFYRDDFSVKSDFISTNRTYYNAEVVALDFSNEQSTLSRVNG